MSKQPHWIAHSDSNAAELIRAIHACGLPWWDLHRVGAGWPDGAIRPPNPCSACRARRPYLVELVEFKLPEGTLNPKQEWVHGIWPVRIVRTLADIEVLARGDKDVS